MNTHCVMELGNSECVPSEWAAFLRLDFSLTKRGVRLVNKEHQGPLYVQKPFYPEGLTTPHVYLLHPPGGLVSGDQLNITINLNPKAQVLVTTPGAGRMYTARADNTAQQQTVVLNVGADANVEWLPLEAILFPGSNAQFNTDIHLADNAKVIYWDVVSFGLPANAQTFDHGSFNQKVSLTVDGRLKLQERLIINDSNRSVLSEGIGFRHLPVQGVMIAGPFKGKETELLSKIRQSLDDSDLLAAVTQVDEFIVVRSLALCSEKVRKLYEEVWSDVRPALLNKPACAPRIWST